MRDADRHFKARDDTLWISMLSRTFLDTVSLAGNTVSQWLAQSHAEVREI